MNWIDFKELDILLKLENLINQENIDNNKKTWVFEEDFCDLLNFYAQSHELNKKVKIKNPVNKHLDKAYKQELTYKGKKFCTTTSVEISHL